jgi:hypothetical protein
MKTVLVSLSLLVLLLSCGKSDQEISAELHAKIQGDWYLQNENNNFYLFSFEDSLFNNNYEDHYCHYCIRKDTLIIDHQGKTNNNHLNKEMFKIIYIGKKWMKLLPLVSTKDRFDSFYNEPTDTLRLQKMQPKNSIKPTSFGVYIGATPMKSAIYMEIKSNREILFQKDHHFQDETVKKGKLSHSEYAEVMRYINLLPMRSMKESYASYVCGFGECALTINYNDKQKHIDLHDFDDTPVELQLLFTKLELLPSKWKLKESEALPPFYFMERNICYHYDFPMELPPPFPFFKN